MRRIVLIVLMCALVAVMQLSGSASGSAGLPTSLQKPSADCSTVGDSQITQDVKARLANSSLKEFTINVETNDGAVTLTGGVKTGAQKGTATRMIKAVNCVKKVVNQLTVEPRESKRKTGS
jgi:osmotically-inducible protein OsmY